MKTLTNKAKILILIKRKHFINGNFQEDSWVKNLLLDSLNLSLEFTRALILNHKELSRHKSRVFKTNEKLFEFNKNLLKNYADRKSIRKSGQKLKVTSYYRLILKKFTVNNLDLVNKKFSTEILPRSLMLSNLWTHRRDFQKKSIILTKDLVKAQISTLNNSK